MPRELVERARSGDLDAKSGINVAVGADTIISQNAIAANSLGVNVGGSSPEVRDDRLEGNGTGIAIAFGSPVVEGNTIEGGRLAILQTGPDAQPSLSGNTVCAEDASIKLAGGATMPVIDRDEVCPAVSTDRPG